MKAEQNSLLKATAEAGSVRAMHEFGLQCDDPDERKSWLRKAVKIGATASTKETVADAGSSEGAKTMITPEITRMIEAALSSGRPLREIEDYLDWREHIEWCSSSHDL